VDPETGVVTLVDVAAVADVGKIINPLIVDGQMHGGLAQGLGRAPFEAAISDERGHGLPASVRSDALPGSARFSSSKGGNHVTACTHNPLGAKGVGEVGAIGVPPAAINAILDALRPLGVTDIQMPATPEKVWRAIRDARGGKAR